MRQMTHTTVDGVHVKRVSKAAARKLYDEGLPIDATDSGSQPFPYAWDMAVTRKEMDEAHYGGRTFDQLANEWEYYSVGRVFYWTCV